MRTHRISFALLGLLTLCLGSAVVACSGDDGGGDQATPDGGPGDTGAGAADSGADVSSLHGDDAGDAAAEASPSGDDGGNDTDDGGPDAADGGPDASPAATLLLPGDVNIFGITPEDMVVYIDANGELGAVSVAGGSPETIGSDALGMGGGLAGSLLWWNTLAVAGGDAGCSGALSLHTWSAALGATTLPSPAYGYIANVSPDGSKIAYLAPFGDCSASVGVTVANTDGTGAPISLPMTWPNSLVTIGFPTAVLTFGSNGALLMSNTSSQITADVFVGASYATHTVSLGSLTTNATMDPSGAWLWATNLGGGQLVRTSDGAVMLTDASATQGAFDASGTYLFTTDADGKMSRVTLSNLATSITVAPSGSGGPLVFAPNGGAVAYLAGLSDAGMPTGPIEIVSVGAGGAVSAPVALAATNSGDWAWFLDDARWVAWTEVEVSSGLASESVGGGPVQTLLPQQVVQSVTAVRSSLVVAVTGATNAMSLVDVTGATPPRLLSTATSGNVAVSPSGGFVAFTNASPNGLYVAGTF